MKLLFVHQGFPGQYIHILRALANQQGHQIVALGVVDQSAELPNGIQYFKYGTSRGTAWFASLGRTSNQSDLQHADAATAEKQGFPDLI